MKHTRHVSASAGMAAFVLATGVVTLASIMAQPQPRPGVQPFDGQQVFRFDTFGNEQLWTDTLRLHEPVATLSPAGALNVGLKVDVEALPPAVIDALKMGFVDLDDPAVTVQLLALNAVVGVIGHVSNLGELQSVACCSTRHTFTTAAPPIWMQS